MTSKRKSTGKRYKLSADDGGCLTYTREFEPKDGLPLLFVRASALYGGTR